MRIADKQGSGKETGINLIAIWVGRDLADRRILVARSRAGIGGLRRGDGFGFFVLHGAGFHHDSTTRPVFRNEEEIAQERLPELIKQQVRTGETGFLQ